MTRKRNVETLRGTGRVLEDDQARVLVQEVGYVVIIQQEIVDSSPVAGAEEKPGVLSARGYLVHDHFNPDVAGLLIGKDVDLELSDGRRWPCSVQDDEGSLVGRHAFKPPLTAEQRARQQGPTDSWRHES
ncbi:MAG TPA: hypothetical protein VES67_10425 [Vicinamibacterales bacterium]|nr:hypothetical protein [Vicinamibacterales bacterium]